jgi:hypothetical protein
MRLLAGFETVLMGILLFCGNRRAGIAFAR